MVTFHNMLKNLHSFELMLDSSQPEVIYVSWFLRMENNLKATTTVNQKETYANP